MNITIIGAGPRGLSVALYALYKNYNITLIDSNPLHTWTSDYLIADLEMRSPLSFDLVTYIEGLQEFSLANYLELDYAFTNNQTTIESSKTKVTREQFCSYLQWVYSYLEDKITIIQQTVVDVQTNKVYLANNTVIESDVVVFCTGYQGKSNIPNWLANTNISNKQIKLSTVLQNKDNYLNKKWLVVGSGQGAAETVEYLCNLSGNVTWAVNKKAKVSQYPAPTYSQWGSKSALGGYYKSLTNYKDRLDYLKKVKQWQPSITPYIANKLKQVNYQTLQINNYNDISNLYVDYVVLAAGITPLFNALPTSTLVPTNAYLPNFPDITANFKINLPNCNWYTSGILATAYDGPRQHSLISAGLTAKEIIEDIDASNI
jgi:lysine/ornithine N-monooxygenase